jgi:alkylation response protein AidB-like acyl-CoA dehydrogenase
MLIDREIFDDTHREFRRSVRGFLARELVPHMEEWNEAGVVPREFWRKCGEQGLLSPSVPAAYGGAECDFFYNAIIIEEAGYTGFTGWGVGVHSDIVTDYVRHYGTEEQKRYWLPKFMSGEAIAAIAMTEPGTGSDLRGIRTTAVEDGDEFVISGSKTFISNGQTADVVIVVARLSSGGADLGLSLFLVEAERAGFRRGRNLRKLGMKGQDTSELFFQDVRIPRSNLLGTPGRGMSMLMASLPQERLSIALLALSGAQKAFDITVDYVLNRRAFGVRIADFQNTKFKLADLKTQIAVGWAYLDQSLVRHVRGELTADDAAMLKLWTTEMQGRVVDECLQLHGGYGYMHEYEISRLYADARIQRIYGGTSEIMREIIGRTIVPIERPAEGPARSTPALAG